MANLPGRPLSHESERKNLPSKYMPKAETDEQKLMYAYYEQLGDRRTLQKVASKFNKSRATMALLARAFRWRDRIDHYNRRALDDPLITEAKPKLDRTRKKMIEVVDEITATLYEMMFLSKDIRNGRINLEDPETKNRVQKLSAALAVWGFEWKKPKDLKDLIATLAEVKEFGQEASTKSVPTSATQINAEKFELHIKEEIKDEGGK